MIISLVLMGSQQTIYSCSSLTGFASWYPSVCYFGPEINLFFFFQVWENRQYSVQYFKSHYLHLRLLQLVRIIKVLFKSCSKSYSSWVMHSSAIASGRFSHIWLSFITDPSSRSQFSVFSCVTARWLKHKEVLGHKTAFEICGPD